MVRNISKKNLAIAGILTLCIFLLGIMLGVNLSAKRLAYGEDQMKQQKLDLDSMQMQYNLVQEFKFENSCAALSTSIEDNVKKLSEIGEKIEQYSSNMNFDEASYANLKREYTIAQLRLWLFARKAKEQCSKDLVTAIYFYSNEKECTQCSAQSKILTHMKGQLKDKLLIFSIDATFKGEPLIDLLRGAYNISSYPSLLVNDKFFQGMVTEAFLKKDLCSVYKEPNPVCG
ncbi:MAG: hypothetical protein V1678_01875 [Candidatus Aenigmatarchaeota archaeon]